MNRDERHNSLRSCKNILYIIPRALSYAGSKAPDLSEKLAQEILESDILVEVNCTPGLLPLSMLDDKREGDVIKLSIENKQRRLVCQQIGYRDGKKKFQKILKKLKDNFGWSPNYMIWDEQLLLDLQVLERKKNSDLCAHSICGYKTAHK